MVKFVNCFPSQMVMSWFLGEYLPTLDGLKIRTKLNFCLSNQECFLACVCSLGIQSDCSYPWLIMIKWWPGQLSFI